MGHLVYIQGNKAALYRLGTEPHGSVHNRYRAALCGALAFGKMRGAGMWMWQ